MKQRWCIPPKANADFVWHMEDVLAVYQRPYDPRFPQVCMDEASKQLLDQITPPLLPTPGQPAREDYEYVRGGTANLFILCEPLRGWRGRPLGSMTVTARRTKVDWAHCIKALVDIHYPAAEKIVLVMDNLNTHTPAALYEAFPPAEARNGWRSITRRSTVVGSICPKGTRGDRVERPGAAMFGSPHPR